MDSRRLTVFPRTGNGLDNARFAGRNGDARPPQAPKRKVQSSNESADPKLPKLAPTLRVKRKTFTPIDRDPEQHYRCIHSVDPEGDRPYCLAQEIASDAAEHAYRVVMIRRSPDKPVVGLDKPNPNLLNIVSVFRFQDSLFTVFDRPGLPLSEIAVSHSPQLGLAEVKTISTEALSGICALNAAGLHLPSIDVEDITVSASDGQVKVGECQSCLRGLPTAERQRAFDQAQLHETAVDGKASAFGVMLEDLVSRVPSRSALQQSDNLQDFIRHADQATYRELQKVDMLLTSDSTELRHSRTPF
ncbi:unnamed protein product [Alternaria alternata]